jgi:uracil-DNA glycosylase
MGRTLPQLLGEIRACELCAGALPLGPRPVLRAAPSARIMVIGQAPGTKVHETGIPWNDASGDRLRAWMRIDSEDFYDDGKLAIIPMGFCYPGRLPRGGDCPPRPECAPAWHEPLLALLPNIELIILAGSYAQRRYLAKRGKKNLTENVRAWREFAPRYIPLPHPSWRTTGWQKRNPWFDTEVLPYLRKRVVELL